MKTLKFPNHLAAGFPHRSVIFTLCAVAITMFLSISSTFAADSTWNVDAAGDWGNSTNWTSGVPGSTSCTTNTDIATFGANITASRVITIDADRNIGGITFNYNRTAGGDGYSLKNDIRLSSGGVIKEISTALPSSSRVSRFQNDVRIQGDGGYATIRNDATSSNVRMYLNGVSGNSTSGNTTILYLDGSNTAANTISSEVRDGSNGGNLAIVKTGNGYWRLASPTSNYSGGTTLNAGTLQYSAGNVTTSTVFGTGALTINGGTLQNTETAMDTKPFTTISNTIVVGGNFQFSARINNTSIFSGAMDLTGATRQIGVVSSTDSAVILSGVISNGSLTKTGNRTMILRGENTYTGNTTVSDGTLILDNTSETLFSIGANGVNNAILGSGTISLNGTIRFDLSGADTTAGNSWNIVSVGTLTETFDAGFTVNSTLGAFTESSGNWTLSNAGKTWTFQESTGILNVVPEPGTLALAGLGLSAILLTRRRRLRS